MKNTLNNGSAVQASNSLGANGGILGAAVAQWQKVQDIKITKGLIDYKHNLNLDRDTHRTAMDIAADQAHLRTAHDFNMVRDAAASKSKLNVAKEEGRQKRLTNTHTNKSGLKTMEKMTAGQEKAAGLPLSGGIGGTVAGPLQFHGQIQAFKNGDEYHPLLGMRTDAYANADTNANSGTGNGNASTADTSAPKANTRAKKAKKTGPMFAPAASANPSKPNNLPVPTRVANPFTGAGVIPSSDSAESATVTKPKITKTPTNNVRKKAASNPPITPANEAPDAPSSPVSPVVEPAKQKPVTKTGKRGSL